MKCKIIFFLLFLNICSGTFAQVGTSLWSTIGVKKKIAKKFNAEISFTSRQPENISYLQTYFYEGSVGFKINKIFDISLTYRNIHRKKNMDAEFKKRHRYFADLGVSKKLGKIKLSNRTRYQHQFKDNDIETTFDASYIRDKVEVGYIIKKNWETYASFDFFYDIQNKQLDQLRPKIGTEYTLGKHHVIDLGLLQNRSLIGIDNSGAIISLAYTFKF
jgi:Protein of unknown function (DUF2490)